MSLFDRGPLPALEAILDFTNARHTAIANNIANAETVGYKAIDASEGDFRKALARAFRAQRESAVGAFEMKGRPARFEESRETGILRHIENNVDIDMEMGRLVKNAQLHNLAATLLAHQFAQMRIAIGERVA